MIQSVILAFLFKFDAGGKMHKKRTHACMLGPGELGEEG